MPLVEVQGSTHVVSYVNAAFCALVGKNKAELVGKSFAEIVPGGEECIPLLDKIYQTGEAITLAKHVDPEDDPASWLYAMWPALDPHDQPVGVIVQVAKVTNFRQKVTAINEALLLAGLRQQESAEAAERMNGQLQGEIVERKRAEKALRESEGQLVSEVSALARLHELSGGLWRSRDLHSSLGQMLDAAIALVGADMGTVQILNPQKQVLEIVVQRGFQQDFLDFFREVSADANCTYGRTLRERQRTIVEDVTTDASFAPYRQAAAAAGFRSVQSTPLLGREGMVLGVVSTHARAPGRPSEPQLRRLDLYVHQAADFIEWMQGRAAITKSEERLRFMAESMPQKIFTTMPNGDVDYFNQQWMEFTGLAFEEIKDWGWTRFIHPDDAEANLSAWKRSSKTGEPVQLEHRFRRADGVYRWHLSRALPMRNAEGQTMMWIGSSTDIHDQKEITEQLAATDRHKDEFLAMLAHELRNPLAPIKNAAYLLRMLKSENVTVVRAQEIIERQADHLAKLVDDLLDVSRVGTGKVRLRKEHLNLTKVVLRAVDSCEHLVKAQGHTVTLDLQRIPPLRVDADPTRADQILVNLIGNAAKYTPSHGTIHIKAAQEGAMAVVSVRDNGVGLSADMLQRVFDVFTQVEQSLERSQGGLGLGLKLVKELVELHGGTVEARSEGLGKGSEFIVRLPALENDDLTSIPEVGIRPVRGAKRVLVVDDNEDIRATMEMFLSMSGHTVELAQDGQEAVEKALSAHPDVAFIDIGLPKLSGYDVAREIRRQPRGKGIVLIALSGYGRDEDKRQALDAGFDAHLTKPVDVGELTKILNELGTFQRSQG
ncbi:MAG: ATP-binding protein [Minicystis sp.]